MAAEDELALPQVPEAKPEDPEDVSWALSTAEAMWARGDHLEGIKWVRKAAEAASDVEDDNRALELAKSASDLATMISRRSRASIGDGPGTAGGAPPEPMAPPPTSVAPSTTRSQVPPAPSSAKPPPMVPSPTGSSRSVPPAPIPLPSKASQPPPRAAAQAPRAAPRPLATSDARQGPQPGRGILSNQTAPAKAEPSAAVTAPAKNTKGRRRSRENLEGEARAAGVLDTAPQTAVDGPTAERALSGQVEVPTTSSRARRRSRPEPDPTIVARREDLLAQVEREKSAEEWDALPTQNLTGDEMDHMHQEGDRATTAFAPPPAAPPPVRAPTPTVHDPEIQTSQAVRVVIWRDATGVHVAPAGTVVSSITIDAVLVVLEPSADLTAWLSQRER